MTHEQLSTTIIKNVLPAGVKPMLWSPPGLGKTDLVGQMVSALEKVTSQKWNYHTWDMTYLYDPADSRGIPTKHKLECGTEVTKWLPPEHMVMDQSVPTVILLDDLPTLPQTSQAACFRLLQKGEIGGIKFGPNTFFMGAGNRQGDQAATNSMPFPLANRFQHFNLTFTLDGWTQWALANGVDTALIGFHRFTRGEALYPIYNDSDQTAQPCGLCKQNVQPGAICGHCVKKSRALPTLRSWGDTLNRLLLTKPDPSIELELYAGAVGKEKAAEFCGYLRMYRQIPSIESILMGPSAAPVPSEPSVLYAVATALGRTASPTNMDGVVEYLERWQHHEIGAVAMKDAARRCPDTQHTRAYMAWATRHQDLLS